MTDDEKEDVEEEIGNALEVSRVVPLTQIRASLYLCSNPSCLIDCRRLDGDSLLVKALLGNPSRTTRDRCHPLGSDHLYFPLEP